MFVAVAALLLSAQTAPVAEPVAVPASETTKTERKICRRESSAVGLHRSKRVCLTASEWKLREGRGNVDGISDASTRGN